MVCLGNICRSPMAEGILRSMVEKEGLDWEVDSCGTGSYHIGEGPDPRGLAVALKYGIDNSALKARQFRKEDLDDFDLICVMDQSNFNNVSRHATEAQKAKIHLIMNFSREGENKAVPDPYYDDNMYEPVYHLIHEACAALVEQFKTENA